MKWNLLTTIILPFLPVGCIEKTTHISASFRAKSTINTLPATVAAIPYLMVLHAFVMVMDIAVNSSGNTIYLLAQNIHLLINPMDSD